MASGFLVEPGRLHRDRDLCGRRLEPLDLGPVWPSAGRTVVAHLEHAGGLPPLEPEGNEDADQVAVPAGLEDLRCEGERGL